MNINKLINNMTLEEKVGQLTQTFSGELLDYENNNEYRKTVNLEHNKIFQIGSLSGLGDAEQMLKAQKLVLEKSRLKIPLLNMMDVIHGFSTNYQIALGLGCSFDPEQVKKLSSISGQEAGVNGVNVTYSPMADLTNDPRWGRFMEIPSEDTLLTEQYTKAIVEGFQQNLDASKGHLAACVKHFACYGLAEGGRDYGTASTSNWQLYEKYLKPYKAGIDANTKLVMTAFNTLDGIACSGNYHLLRHILRHEFNFEGVIISDHSSIAELVNHGIAKDEKQAAKIAIECGVDIELATTCYAKYLAELVEEGEVDIKYVDESVRRVLTLKDELGLFENPNGAINIQKAKNLSFSRELYDLYKQSSIDSFVLLENKNETLPLSKLDDVCIVGTHYNNKDLIGFNACCGSIEKVTTIKDAFLKNSYKHTGLQITDYEKLTEEEKAKAKEIFSKSKVAVLPLGEQSRWSGEGVSRANIKLPNSQIELVKLAREHCQKVVVIVFNGRPLDLSDISDIVDSLIIAWFPGDTAGDALFDVLTGKENFSGKLSCTFLQSVSQIPLYYNCLPTGRQKKYLEQEYVNGYRDLTNDPLYPFGYGLSYSTYEYGKLVQVNEMTYKIDVTNKSKYKGKEIVQLYIRDLVADVSRPIKELKMYEKILLEPGETKTVEFEITEDMLEYYNSKLEYKMDSGDFEIFIGPNSRDCQSIVVNIKKK